MESELLQDQSLGEKLIKKGFWLYLFSFLIAPAGYIIKVLISNSVSVADVGVLYTIVGLMALLNVYNDLGLTESLQYFLPRYWIKKQYDYVKTSIYLSLFVQVFTALIIILFLRLGAPWLASHYFHSDSSVIILRYFCIYFLGINLFQVLQSIFMAFQNTFAYQFVEFVKMRGTVGFTFFFFLSGRQDIQRYSLNWILGLAVGIIVASIIFGVKYRKTVLRGSIVFDKPMLKEYFNYALWCFIGLNALNLFAQVIQQLMIVILGPEAAGYYTNFVSLFGMPGILLGPIISLIFPMVSELIAKNDSNKLTMLYKFFYTYFTVFGLLIAMFFIALGQESALVLFGHKFIFSGDMFVYGAIFTIFNNFVGFNFAVLAGMGKIKERVKMLLISAVVVTIISIIGFYTIGIYASVIALGTGYLLLFLLSFRLIYKSNRFNVDWKFIIKNAILGGILAIVLFQIKSELFVFDDSMRGGNLLKMAMLALGFFVVFVAFNLKRALALKDEVMRLRDNN